MILNIIGNILLCALIIAPPVGLGLMVWAWEKEDDKRIAERGKRRAEIQNRAWDRLDRGEVNEVEFLR